MCPKQPFSSTDHIFWVDDISYDAYNYEQLMTMSIILTMMKMKMISNAKRRTGKKSTRNFTKNSVS